MGRLLLRQSFLFLGMKKGRRMLLGKVSSPFFVVFCVDGADPVVDKG